MKVARSTLLNNFKPATGEQILLYGGNGTDTITIKDSGHQADAFTLGGGYVTFIKATFVAEVPADLDGQRQQRQGTRIPSSALPTPASTAASGNNTFNVSTGRQPVRHPQRRRSSTRNTLSYSKFATGGVVVDLLRLGHRHRWRGQRRHHRHPQCHRLAEWRRHPGGRRQRQHAQGQQGPQHPDRRLRRRRHTRLGRRDIMIAGTSSYDSNTAALQFILGEWKTSTSSNFGTVINNIETSGTDPLSATQVTDSGSPDLADTLQRHITARTWIGCSRTRRRQQAQRCD